MPLLDLEKLTAGLTGEWPGYLVDWDRTLRAGNYPETTRYNYLLAAAQLGRYLDEYSPDPEAVDAAQDPTAVLKRHVESYLAWMIETRSASTALNKYKGAQQFFRWLVEDEEAMDRSPMTRVRQPKVPKKEIPIMRDEETKALLDSCEGRTFAALRDEAIMRLYYNTAGRLAEVAGLNLDDLDARTDSVLYRGKGDKQRRVRYGPRTARALSRYLRARAKRKGAGLPNLWLAEKGARPLGANGIKMMIKRRGRRANLAKTAHAHRWRHNYCHEWKRAGGDTGDLMIVMGWTSEEMARRYGDSAAAERAQETQARMGIGENV